MRQITAIKLLCFLFEFQAIIVEMKDDLVERNENEVSPAGVAKTVPRRSTDDDQPQPILGPGGLKNVFDLWPKKEFSIFTKNKKISKSRDLPKNTSNPQPVCL
ncbi:MAG: hypothetical protein WCT18_03420 [Patescibacteria group bacterium]